LGTAAVTVDELLAALDGLPAFLSVAQAGAVIGLSRSAAYRAADRGELPTVRLSGRLRVPIGALLALMGLIEPAGGDRTTWARALVGAAT
jgi:hypothetical protein